MFPLILLQTIAEHTKPAAVAIAEGGSVVQPVLLAIATGLAGFFLRSLVIRPAEKAELYEQAKIQAIADSLNEHKRIYESRLIEWEKWREAQANRVTTLELTMKNTQETLSLRIKDMSSDLAQTKEMTQEIRETLAGFKVQLETTINKWSK